MAALHELILKKDLKEQEDFYFTVLRDNIDYINEVEIFENLLSNRIKNRESIKDVDPFYMA